MKRKDWTGGLFFIYRIGDLLQNLRDRGWHHRAVRLKISTHNTKNC